MGVVTAEATNIMRWFHAIENMLNSNSNGTVALKEATIRFYDPRTGNYDEMNWTSEMSPKEWTDKVRDDQVVRNRFEEENTKHRRELGQDKNDD